jgi:mono/diheme cytochrome c family protein
MRRRLAPYLLLCGLLLAGGAGAAQTAGRENYDVAYIGAPLPDPLLQYSKETYVIFGCAYCHGVNLVPRGEAADLRTSALVGGDVNANLIGPLLRTGIPQTAKLSPMPQYSDLSDQQVAAIARWIHYARQRSRYEQLTAAAPASGDQSAGRAYFERACVNCHSTPGALSSISRTSDGATLRREILAPTALGGETSYRVDHLHDANMNAARERHDTLLENYSAQDVAHLVAFLQSGG